MADTKEEEGETIEFVIKLLNVVQDTGHGKGQRNLGFLDQNQKNIVQAQSIIKGSQSGRRKG